MFHHETALVTSPNGAFRISYLGHLPFGAALALESLLSSSKKYVLCHPEH